jgi:hypothetical protein
MRFYTHVMTVSVNGSNRLSKFYSPTDAQLSSLKNNFKIYIKIDIKTAPTSSLLFQLMHFTTL